MFSNTTPLNWYNTLRRLKKEGDFNGYLGKELGLLPGRKAFASQLQGLTTKHRPTHVISEAAAPLAKKVNKVHKVNKKLQEDVKKAGVLSSEMPSNPVDSTPAAESPSEVPQPQSPSEVPQAQIQQAPQTPKVSTQQQQQIEDILKSTTLSKNKKNTLKKALVFLETGILPTKKLSENSINEARILKETYMAGSEPPPTVRDATTALLSPSNATTRLTPVKSVPQMISKPAEALQSVGSRHSLIPRRLGKKASSVKKVSIEIGKSKAGTPRALYRKKKDLSAPQNIIPPLEKVVKQLRPRKPQNKRTAPLEHEGKYDNPNNAAIAHKYPLHKLRSKPKKDKKNVKQRLFKGGLVQELVDAGKGLLQMAGIGSRETAPGETAPTTESSPQKYDYNSFRKANGGKKWTPKKMGAEWKVYKQSNGL